MPMDPINPKEIKKRLIDLDLTYAQVADEMNISTAYLSDLINGNRKSEERLAQLKEILKMDGESDEV